MKIYHQNLKGNEQEKLKSQIMDLLNKWLLLVWIDKIIVIIKITSVCLAEQTKNIFLLIFRILRPQSYNTLPSWDSLSFSSMLHIANGLAYFFLSCQGEFLCLHSLICCTSQHSSFLKEQQSLFDCILFICSLIRTV